MEDGVLESKGERLLDVVMAFDLAIYNTFFKKKEREYMTHKTGDTGKVK